jgi:SAM-dependent methyltransferase
MEKPLSMDFDPPLVECPLCRSRRLRFYDRDWRGITICRCCGCGVKLMNPQYSDAYLAAFYASYITPYYPFAEDIRVMALKRKAEILTRISNYASAGRFFSIGCGDGIELTAARERGWKVEGYDVDPATTQRVAKALDVPVYCGPLGQLRLPANSYDCVYMDQVLEHPKRPAECLLEASRILRPRGVLFVGCPNIMSLSAVGKTLLGRLHLKRSRGKHYDTAHHLFYYSPRVLRNLLEQRYGFKVLHVQGDPLIWQRRDLPWIKASAQRFWPCLDSTFQLFARKETDAKEPSAEDEARDRAA